MKNRSLNIDPVYNYIEQYRVKLWEYAEILSSYSSRTRLTGPRDAETLFSEHIQDCIFSLPLMPAMGRVIDVGTGGGLPGLVWAICRPDLEVFLLDSIRKKSEAVKAISSELGLSNVTVVCDRAENWAVNNREIYDLAGARAVTSSGVLTEYLSPLTRTGGSIIAFKGPKLWDEIEAFDEKWNRLGLSDPVIYSYRVNDRDYYIVKWSKLEPCPLKYPRRPGLADRKPWWR